MDEASIELERAAANLVGVEAQFLPKANRREAISVGVEDRLQKLAVVRLSSVIIVEARERLQCGPTKELRKSVREGSLGPEEVEAGKDAANAIDHADLPLLWLEGLEKAFNCIGPALEAVAESAGGRR